MCLLNWDPNGWGIEYQPNSQPIPTLTWAMPVDPTRLSASIEKYYELQPAANVIRLCHRFRPNHLLSRLPQEVLDNVLEFAHRGATESLLVWAQQSFKCFQGRCHSWGHFEPYGPETERLWSELNPNWHGDEPSEEAKVELVRAYLLKELAGDPIGDINREISEAHGENNWDYHMCTCRAEPRAGGIPGGFVKYITLLESHFGLQAIVIHEALSETMRNFLPRVKDSGHDFEYPSCHTLAFLVLQRQLGHEGSLHLSTNSNNPIYAGTPSPVGYWEVVDPKSLALTENQRLRFKKAMKVLDLKPHYALTRLESLIDPALGDQALGALSHRTLPLKPASPDDPARYDWLKRMDAILEEVIENKSKGS
ncbi:hypothetical protein BDV96DRAFT_102637 [Lophiotrema nucula]|uniref:Uncharacterized protein n=1 Tax=Lophiotrema nucula TaxID=690887 RepID=A0A6A5Z8E5_9PLEO|nr:hypothetical protein BDV96DRAFT_102637 [Lophiotrema nucula]